MDVNGSANGTDYRRRARDARARVAALRLEAEARLLESWGVEPQPGYPTSWYDPFDAGRSWGLPPAWLWPGGGRDARADGADRPFVWHEVDLDRSRGLARWLAAKNLWAVGTLNTLTNYAVKTGFKWEVTPAAGMGQDRTALVLARLAQRVIDEFSDLNTLPFWEREAFSTSRRDGECFYRFFGQDDDGVTLLRPVLPEQVRQPLGSPPSCTFGIETDPRDVLRPVCYYVDYEAGATDGYARDDYEDVPASEMAHLKLNVDAVVKRGLSDFYCCHEAFDELSKLLRNMRITAGIQSAVAWYERFPTVATDTLGGLAGARRDLNRPQLTDPLSGRQLNYERFEPGQVRLINGNREFIPAPLAQNTSQHISILQACLRALGRRWDMPEYMASGDASNANYASTLVAGSPFVNAVECEQARYLVHFRRWQMAALKNAAAAGRFRLGGRAWPFEDLMRLVAVHGTPPAVAVANRQAEAMQDLQDLAAGVTSLQVVRGKRGLDSAKVEQDLREQPPTRVVGRATDVDPSGNPVGPGGGGGGPAREGRRRDPFERALLEAGFTGTITDKLGRERHYVAGRQVAGPPEGGAADAPAGPPIGLPFPVPYKQTLAAAADRVLGRAALALARAGDDRLRAGGVRAAAAAALEKVVARRGATLLGAFRGHHGEAVRGLREYRAAHAAGVLLKSAAWTLGYRLGLDDQDALLADFRDKLTGFQASVLGLSRAAGAGPGVRESLLREGFTGVITDSLGRKVHYRDGKRVKVEGGPHDAASVRRALKDAHEVSLPGGARLTVGEEGGRHTARLHRPDGRVVSSVGRGTRKEAVADAAALARQHLAAGGARPPAPAAPAAKGPDAAPAAGGYGTAGQGHPLAGLSRPEAFRQLARYVGAVREGDNDPAGLRAAGPPAGLDLDAFGRDAAAFSARHYLDRTVAPGIEALYADVGKDYGLTKRDFQRALVALDARDVLSIRGQGFGTDRLDQQGYDPELVVPTRGGLSVHASLPGEVASDPGRLRALADARPARESRRPFEGALLEAGFTGVITDSLGRKVHYRDGKRVKVEGGPGAGHEEAAAAMRAAHPFPTGAVPPELPGSGRPDLLAQDPVLRDAEARRADRVRRHHRAFVAYNVDLLLHAPPPAPLPPPDPSAPVARKAALARKAVLRFDDAAGTETMLGPAFESHAREAAAAHPGGPAALAAAREEAARRTADAARQLAPHLEGLAAALPDPAHRPLTRTDLSRGHLIDVSAVHPEVREAVTALAARLPHAEHAPSGLRLAVGDTPGAKAALAVLRDLGAARRPGEDEDAKETVLAKLGGRLPPDLRGKG